MQKPAQFVTEIISQRQVASQIWEMWLAPHPAIKAATPGQFVMPTAGAATDMEQSYDPLLRRPISICQVDKAGRWSLIYRVAGKGTACLSRLPAGAAIDVLGPLGNGYAWPKPASGSPVLIGGGVGTPPLVFLAQRLVAEGYRPQVYLGFASRSVAICVDEFNTIGISPVLATDDGSLGSRGYVVDLLPGRPAADTYVYACGPLPMLRAVADWCRAHSLPAQVSLEERMACGVGVCLGCVCQAQRSGAKAPAWERVCREGPVFPLEVVANAL